MEPWIGTIITVLSFVFGGGGIVAWMESRYRAQVAQAEVFQKTVDGLVSASQDCEQRTDRLEVRIVDLEGKLEAANRQLARARAAISQLIDIMQKHQVPIPINILDEYGYGHGVE